MIRRGRSRSAAIPRALLEDDRLSWKAKGLGAFLLSKPQSWRIDGTALAHMGKDGRSAVLTALQELEDGGYLVRRRYQNPDNGQWWSDSVLYESPQAAIEEADDPLPEVGFSDFGLPNVGSPNVGPGDAKSLESMRAVEAERTTPPTPAERGTDASPPTNSRANGTNPRALGTNPRGPKPPDPMAGQAAAMRQKAKEYAPDDAEPWAFDPGALAKARAAVRGG